MTRALQEDLQIKERQLHQELQEKQQTHGQSQLTVQSPTRLQPSSLSRQELHEKDREIQRLTQQLEVTSKELQDTKQQQIDMIKLFKRTFK